MIEFDKIPDELKTNWEKLATSTAEYEFLDQMIKVKLAHNAPLEWTETHKEREARKSDDFQKHLEWVRIAREEMLKAKTYQEALQARFEWYRTKNANLRAEMKII